MTSAWIKVRNLEDLFVGSAATTSPSAPKNEDFKTKWTKFEEGGSREGTRGIRSRGKGFRAFALIDYPDYEVLSTFKPTPKPPTNNYHNNYPQYNYHS